MFEEVLAQNRRALGPRNVVVADSLHELGAAQREAGHAEAAFTSLRGALSIKDEVVGRQSVPAAFPVGTLGIALAHRGDAAAEPVLRESVSIRERLLQPDDLALLRSRYVLGRWLMGHPAGLREGCVLQSQVAAARRARLPEGSRERTDSALMLAECAVLQDELPAAASALAALAAQGPPSVPYQRALLARAQGLLATARHDAAAALNHLRQACKEVVAAGNQHHPSWRRLRVELAGAALAARGPSAARAERSAVADVARSQAPDSPLRIRAERLLAALGSPAD